MDLSEILMVICILILVTGTVFKCLKTGKISPEDMELLNKLIVSLKHSYENNNFAVFLDDMAIKIRAGEFDKSAVEVVKFLKDLLPDQNQMRKADIEFLIKMIRERK